MTNEKHYLKGQSGPYRVFREINIQDIEVDTGYQRDIRNPIVQKIKREGWNEFLGGVLVISAREDGSFYVIDGQHRITALTMIGGPYKHVAEVWYGLTRSQEAMMFAQSQEPSARTAITPADLHKAYMQMDPGMSLSQRAWAIEEVMQDNGFYITKETSGEGSTRFRAVEAAYRIESMNGIDVLDSALKVYASAWGSSPPPKATVLQGFAMFIDMFPDARYTPLIRRISKTPIDHWTHNAFVVAEAGGTKVRPVAIVEHLYREHSKAVRTPLPDLQETLASYRTRRRSEATKKWRAKNGKGE